MSKLLPHTGDGIVIDIGTGDGRFVSTEARANPAKFYIGIDANVKALEKPSMKATRNPAKGGLPNAMFIQAAVENLPSEIDGIADEIHIHFPWGSLLRAIATGDEKILTSLRKIAAPDCLLEIVIGLDPLRDESEIVRLDIPVLDEAYVSRDLIPRYESAGFVIVETGRLDRDEWSNLGTSWAKRLSEGTTRTVTYLILRAI